MSGHNQELGQIGVDNPVADVIRRYFPGYPEGMSGQVFADPEVALLAALIKQGEDVEPADYEMDEDEQTDNNYFAEKFTVTAGGPTVGGEEPEYVDGAKINLGMTVDAVDLRFTDAIEVAFKGPNEDHRLIEYRAEDSPIVGKEATTSAMWVTRADAATSDPTLYVEAYENGE
jgi:hypothetical protein